MVNVKKKNAVALAVMIGASVLQVHAAGDTKGKASSPLMNGQKSGTEIMDPQKGTLVINGSSAEINLPPPDFEGMNTRVEKHLKTEIPLTPKQIKMLKKRLTETEIAKWSPVYSPKIENITKSITADANAKIPDLYVTPGYVSTLVFVDADGKSWPMTAGPVVGNPQLLGMMVPSGSKGNVVVLNAKRPSGTTNISVFLQGKDAPIMIKVHNNVKRHMARIDLVMQDYIDGPPDNRGAMKYVPASPMDGIMIALVSGAHIDGVSPLQVSTPDLRAWKDSEGYIYIRTRYDLISPGWVSRVAGADNVRVYKLKKVSNVLYSRGGKVLSAQIR